jgi:hypothetical protein
VHLGSRKLLPDETDISEDLLVIPVKVRTESKIDFPHDSSRAHGLTILGLIGQRLHQARNLVIDYHVVYVRVVHVLDFAPRQTNQCPTFIN